MRKTKIVATLGPACDSIESIRKLIRNGVNVFRLNFSHGSHSQHGQYIRRIRNIAEDLNQPVGILMDLQGPKIRTGPLENGQPVTLLPGQSFTVTTRDVQGNQTIVSTTWADLPRDVKKGDRLLVSDGLIEMIVENVDNSDIHCTIINGGTLSQRQGINLPGVNLSMPALTEKDKVDLRYGLSQGVDFVALSFVRSAEDIRQVKSIAEEMGLNIPVIAKIERPEALTRFPEILKTADGIMVARGDLGVEISPEKVPLVQKQIISSANMVGKPVITATQMLDSMIRNPRPTRAETSDVANAIIDGTDAVMLSGETATGNYPQESVQMLARIAPLAEAAITNTPRLSPHEWSIEPNHSNSEAIADAACKLADNLSLGAIFVLTQSGYTAQLIATRRPQTNVIAFTPDHSVYRQMSLVWGIQPVLVPFSNHLESLQQQIQSVAKKHKLVAPDDVVLLVGGHPLPALEPTNFIKILPIQKK